MESDTGSNPPACSRFSDTPETLAIWTEYLSGKRTDETAIDGFKMIEMERDDAIAEATNAVNDIIAVRYQRDELLAAIRNLRDVSGRHHTKIACERLFALLPENAKSPGAGATE